MKDTNTVGYGPTKSRPEPSGRNRPEPSGRCLDGSGRLLVGPPALTVGGGKNFECNSIRLCAGVCVVSDQVKRSEYRPSTTRYLACLYICAVIEHDNLA